MLLFLLIFVLFMSHMWKILSLMLTLMNKKRGVEFNNVYERTRTRGGRSRPNEASTRRAFALI